MGCECMMLVEGWQERQKLFSLTIVVDYGSFKKGKCKYLYRMFLQYQIDKFVSISTNITG